MNKVNLLYCFDSNYDKQSFLSISSIVNNSKDVFEIYIIHKDPETFELYKNRLLKNSNVENIEIYKFKKNIENYPQLKNKHVSEATYYRLFISEYLPKELDHVLYCDPDVFCVRNISTFLSSLFRKFIDENKPIGVNVEKYLNDENLEYFKNLEMKNNSYFNAGVMLINLNIWNKIVTSDLIKHKIQVLENKIILWDQDVLNSIFDGNYFEISNLLNFRITYPIDIEFFKDNIIFIHYSGNHKPWTVEGALDKPSVYYNKIYQEYFKDKYSLKLKGTRKYALSYLLKSIINKNIFKIDFSLEYFKQFTISIMKK
tara:strand:- start:1647 stop:2588 length:942 start_codon:yes stop_codon:yes gene_type:complete